MRSLLRWSDGKQYVALLLHWRWLVLIIAMPISMVIELLEGGSRDLQILDEVIIDGMVLPLSTWFVLSFVASRVMRQQEHEERLEQHQRFTQRLAEHREYDDLVGFVVRFPAAQLPVAYAGLFLVTEEPRRFELAAQWGATSADPAGREYRFLLLHAGEQIGMLRLRCEVGETPGTRQLSFLTSVMPEIARALKQAIEDSREAERVYHEAQLYERRRITQELHDTLAQQVFYLHLGLDQLAGDRALPDDAIQRKIASMRDVAADVYEQIRHNLSILRAWEQVNLTEAISELARLTAHNAGLVVEIDVCGEPAWLSPHTCEQIYSVAREALNNVVKHARAQHVWLALTWGPEHLSLSVRDDGVGFNPAQLPPEGHYGLALMREGIEVLRGVLHFESELGGGTRLQATIPLRMAEPHRVKKAWPQERPGALGAVA